jgi:hypothetical protein
MVSLAVAECVPPTIEKAIEEGKSLRNSAFWYPQIPGIGLYLNDDYFAARDSSTTRYQPLCWTMFGGPGGRYKSSEYAEVIHFSIDGPDGEVIDAIEVYLRYSVGENVFWFYKHGALESFKVSHSYLKNAFSTTRIASTDTQSWINNSDFYESREILPLQTERVCYESRLCRKAHNGCSRDHH